jgi:DNA mismatch endonuclease, patch repair protein
LRANKIYFQRHYKKVAGCPDIALPSKKLAIFIDGDFWHGWKFEKIKSRLPSVYWKEKIAANIKRDRKNRNRLKRAGWKIIRIWQHDLERKERQTLGRIEIFLKS